MVFVTLGSQKFQFDRLLREIDRLIEKGIITDDVFAQIGASNYVPKNYTYTKFLNRDEFAEKLNSCDTVVTHGGTGVIVKSVKLGKKVLAVARLAKYGEHVDDHQIQIINQFTAMNLIAGCSETEEIEMKYKSLLSMNFSKYESNTETIIKSIEEYIGL